jgi:L-lysine exporter family protein LysE/ArgO
MFSAAQEGLFLGLSLIVAIGAQNLFVLRQGLKHEHVFAVALTCSLIDSALIYVGVAGVGTLIAQNVVLTAMAAWGGALFLFVYGALALKAAIWPQIEEIGPGSEIPKRSLSSLLSATAAFSLLNPHVYLDTVVLLGSIGAQYPSEHRFIFATGAAVASFVWFFAIGFGARVASPILSKPQAQRGLDIFVWVVMWAIAGGLVWSRF